MHPVIIKTSNSEIQSQKFSFTEPTKTNAVIPVGTTMLLSTYNSDSNVIVFINDDMSVFYEITVSDWDKCIGV